MPKFYEIDQDNYLYHVTGRKKRKKEFIRSINVFMTQDREGGGSEIFDKYFRKDFIEFRNRLADCLETITIIGQTSERDKIPPSYWEQYKLFTEAINMLIICYRNIRMGHWLAGLVLLRQAIEIIAVCIAIWFDTKKNLKDFHEGKLKATKCVKTLKKVLPQLVRIWGFLSNYHVHPSKEILGASFIEQDRATGWGRVFIGGYLHPDKAVEIENSVIHVLLVTYYLHAAIELIFWQLIEDPEFWKPVGKAKGLDLGTWNPGEESAKVINSLTDRAKNINSPFRGYENRIAKQDLNRYFKLVDSGRIKGAYDIEGLRKIIKSDQKFYFAIYILANAYRAIDENKKAISLYKHVIKKSDEIHDSYHFLGTIYVEMGEDHKAIEALKKHIEHYPDSHTTLNRLGLIYDKIGEYDNAIESYQKAQSIEKDYYNPIYNEANTLKHKRKYDAAISKYKEAISIKGEPWAYHNMGLTYFEQGNIDEAYKTFRKAIVTDPGFFSSWFNLGAACRIKGNPKKAYLCYLKCIHLNPDSLESAIILANISIDLSKLNEAKMWAEAIQQIKPGCEMSEQIYEQIKSLS